MHIGWFIQALQATVCNQSKLPPALKQRSITLEQITLNEAYLSESM